MGDHAAPAGIEAVDSHASAEFSGQLVVDVMDAHGTVTVTATMGLDGEAGSDFDDDSSRTRTVIDVTLTLPVTPTKMMP
jgi:hypothetical protein